MKIKTDRILFLSRPCNVLSTSPAVYAFTALSLP
jgi:hypothetical protein